MQGRSINITKQIKMNNANRDTGLLNKFISNILLTCENILTYASIYIEKRALFELLL